MHVSMSLRRAGRYGVAFGETVIIAETGCEVLTQLERRLFKV